jgi:NAD(P)H dehydrogenase (quinone)
MAILGATGQLGHRTVEAILARGTAAEQVVAAVRTPSSAADLLARDVEVRAADYDDPDSLKEAFTGCERVLLIPTSAPPSLRVRQYDNAIAAATAAGVRHLVHYGFVPTTVESPFQITPFLLYAESALRMSGLAWTVLRNGVFMDPIVDWVPTIVKMKTIPFPTGNGRCAYITRDDIARAAAVVMTTSGHEETVYNLTGPKALTTAQLCGAVAKATGKPVKPRPASGLDYVEACRSSGVSTEATQVRLSMYRTIREGHLDVVSKDFNTLTGQPAEGFTTYLARRLEEF